MENNKRKCLNLSVQASLIRRVFPTAVVSINRGKMVCKLLLQPSPLSDSYNIKIVYDIDSHPDIYVIKRKLKLFSGATSLPHVYDTAKQHLCVYYRTAKEWNISMPIVDSIIPWTSEWLYHYEFWLATGTWHGKGIHGKPKPFRKTK